MRGEYRNVEQITLTKVNYSKHPVNVTARLLFEAQINHKRRLVVICAEVDSMCEILKLCMLATARWRLHPNIPAVCHSLNVQ